MTINEFTKKEKKILIMLFKIGQVILDVNAMEVYTDSVEFFDKNDLFCLAEKLGIEDDY